ncbi:hypothetical protein OAA60_01905 [Porticoccaceae bacterium]|jgi:hypothetical protein|nr:hypothetical protein [Porticoccaceae bacterium]
MEGNIEIINNSECTISELHNNNNKHEGNRYVLLNNYNTYHTISEKLFSILTHVFIMVCFATYFFFEYVIEIEKKLLLDKINTYFDVLNEYYKTQENEYQEVIKYILYYKNINDKLYEEYKNAQNIQDKKLNTLKFQAGMMVGYVAIFFLLSFINAIRIRKHIHWTHIVVENLLMFLLLGIFEYLFFTHIIMSYTPITDEEIRYLLYNNVEQIINGTYS